MPDEVSVATMITKLQSCDQLSQWAKDLVARLHYQVIEKGESPNALSLNDVTELERIYYTYERILQ